MGLFLFFSVNTQRGLLWRGGERVKGSEEKKLVVFSPLQLKLSASRQVADFRRQMRQFSKSQFSFVLFLCLFLSGGERSGVQPHGTTHPAAPQVGTGHRAGGGQHLRVLQRSLNAPATAAAPSLLPLTAAFSRVRPRLSWGRRRPAEA